jgi:hypothetical protein
MLIRALKRRTTELPEASSHLATRHAARAADDLAAAHQGLLRANLLFGLIQYAIMSGNINEFRAHTLAEIGIKLTRTYGERTQAEARFLD